MVQVWNENCGRKSKLRLSIDEWGNIFQSVTDCHWCLLLSEVEWTGSRHDYHSSRSSLLLSTSVQLLALVSSELSSDSDKGIHILWDDFVQVWVVTARCCWSGRGQVYGLNTTTACRRHNSKFGASISVLGHYCNNDNQRLRKKDQKRHRALLFITEHLQSLFDATLFWDALTGKTNRSTSSSYQKEFQI